MEIQRTDLRELIRSVARDYASLADDMGKHSLAYEIRQSKPGLKKEEYYNADNLTGTKSFQIDKL